MNKIINKELSILKEEFFKLFLNSINSLKSNDKIVIGLSGGNSLKAFYEEIKNKFGLINFDLRNKIYFCFLDERVVDFIDNDSNYKLVKTLLLDELLDKKLIKFENILLPDFSLGNYEQDYFNKVEKIDIGLFGVGEDGHTCSLFPNHNLLDNEKFSYLKINNSPKLPKNRITISKSMLIDIKYAFTFFIGESKKQALNNFLDEKIDYKTCPIKLTWGCENLFLFSDNF